MQTLYRSTRDPKGQTITASQAVLQGLSPDGGLYVPTSIPEIDLDLNELKDLSYQDLAYKILRPLFPTTLMRNCAHASTKHMEINGIPKK